MFKLSNLILALFLLVACGKTQSKIQETLLQDLGGEPYIAFAEKTYDFGEISEGDTVQHIYKFKNTGKSPLIINSVKAGCGCTIPSWSKDPIEPDADGEILVKFNSQDKAGVQNKYITVISNASNSTDGVSFTAIVLAKNQDK